jgi:hypothetical protein
MALRMLTDEDGTVWSVWDVMPQTQQVPAMQGGWLCFESPAEKRRLTPVPAGWHDLAEADLWMLLRSARHVKPSARLSALSEGS